MKTKSIALAAILAVGFAAAAAGPASAEAKRHHRDKVAHCVDGPATFSWDFLWASRPEPQPNGCAPPVYVYGRYVGQDPDPNIRSQMRRAPPEFYFMR
jgi:hypothetical protein